MKDKIIAILLFLAGFLGYRYQATRAARERNQREAAEARRDQLESAQEAQAEARERAQQETADARDHARTGDFSNRFRL